MDGPHQHSGVATLFSASQPNGPSFFSREQFEWSLHYNLLFHPVGLASPDGYFFGPFVYEYLAERPDARTWYESALVEGLIIPFVRDQTISSFSDLWKALAGNSLQGHFENSQAIAKRLDKLNGRATPDHWKPWPAGMGKRFGKLVEDRLSRNVELMVPRNLRPEDADRCIEYLDRTRAYRIDDIEIARRGVSAEHGLRVSEVLWASGRRILGPDVKVKNIEDFLARMAGSSQFSPRDVQDAKQFYKVLIELHNENASSAFDITRNVTDFDVMSRIFSAEGTSDLEVDESLAQKPIFQDIQLPPISLLKTFSFDLVTAARASREFSEYQKTLALWSMKSRDADLARNVTEATQAYVKRIHQLCRQRPTNWDQYRVAIGPKLTVFQLTTKLLTFGAGVMTAYAIEEQMGPVAGIAMAVAGITAAHVAGKLIEGSVDVAERATDHWLYIYKLRQEKVTSVVRDASSIELQDQNRAPVILHAD
jgi:hypothetical protein